jgi:hypothetical protein
MLLVLFLMWLFGYGSMIAAAWAIHPILFILGILFLG